MVGYSFNATDVERQIRQLEKAFQQLDDSLVRHIQGRGLLEMAKVVAKKARSLVRVKSGALRQSIRSRRTSDRLRGRKIPGGSAAVFAGGPNARHAHLIELGTAHASAFPFISVALLADQEHQRQALVIGTARELEKQVRLIAAGAQSRTVNRLITG